MHGHYHLRVQCERVLVGICNQYVQTSESQIRLEQEPRRIKALECEVTHEMETLVPWSAG